MKKWILALAIILLWVTQACGTKSELTLSCSENNDLYKTLQENNIDCARYDSPEKAIDMAKEGTGVMILADGYPQQTTTMSDALYEKAKSKKLRLYVEYPSHLPDMEVGKIKGTNWERAVISSDKFAPRLEKHRILAIHDCRFVTIEAENPDIVVARIAGFDTAVYGLPDKASPILAEIIKPDNEGGLMVSTTKLSQFITARYAPYDAWQSIWSQVLTWVVPSKKIPTLEWIQEVRPSFTAEEQLPDDIEKQALKRGIDWYFNSRMVLNESAMSKYNKPTNNDAPASSNPDLSQNWPFGHRVGYMPDLNTPKGDGTFGVLEGFDAKIFYNGTQPARWWRRGDCNGEIAGAMSAAGVALANESYKETASNIGDWLYFQSMISNGDRADAKSPAFGLFGWNESSEYVGPGTKDGYGVYYGDDNARLMLGMMLAGSALDTDRYDERLLQGVFANLRISGVNGFVPDRVDHDQLLKTGWKELFASEKTSYAPHYQANMWACYIWAYRHTGYELFLTRAKKAIEMTMDNYPDGWKWTNGIQQERAKMLLPLSWLVRIEDTPKHREWLRKVAGDLLKTQHKSGAIREEIGEAGKGGFPPPSSNEKYGTTETPLIQSNEDGVSDMLYTVGFTFLGLHEAAAATGDQYYSDAENKLAQFLCRIQIQSETHPELDGGWFRAFDFNRWEYWASSGDAGWGAWCIESGWSQSWITALFALRQLDISLWDITKDSKINTHLDKVKKQMFE